MGSLCNIQLWASGWLTTTYTTWFGFCPMISCFIESNGLIVIYTHVHYFFYSSHITYTKMCRLLIIHNNVVPSYHIRVYLWCHNIPNHSDVTGSSVTSSCQLFAASVVMTPLLTSPTTTKRTWQQMADPWIVGGSAPQYPMVQYISST